MNSWNSRASPHDWTNLENLGSHPATPLSFGSQPDSSPFIDLSAARQYQEGQFTSFLLEVAMVQGCWCVAGVLAIVIHVGGVGLRAETESSVDLDELCVAHSTSATKSQLTAVCQIRDEQGPLGRVAPKPPQNASRTAAGNAAAPMSTVTVRGFHATVERFVLRRCDQSYCEILELVRVVHARVLLHPEEEDNYPQRQ